MNQEELLRQLKDISERVANLEKEVGIENFTGMYIMGKSFRHTGPKLSFFNTIPVTQPADIGALTNSSGGTIDGTVAAVSGSGADSTINNNFADVSDKIIKIRTALRNLGIIN